MKTFIVNLPYKKRIVRRYKCTYNAPSFLLPPMELMYVAGVLRMEKNIDIEFLDAIAENISVFEFLSSVKKVLPDTIITIMGIETLSYEIDILNKIKRILPECKIICFGYLPTLFPEEVLKKSSVDFIIRGEPELSILELQRLILKGKSEFNSINGIVYKKNTEFIYGPSQKRITELDSLPFPARNLIKIEKYSEPLMPKPFTTITSSRGCPFSCIYCVPSYGRQTIFRSAYNIIEEIRECIENYNVKSIRFMDDTFTLKKSRVIEICDLIIKNGFRFNWSVLSRPDMLSKDILYKMKQAGCRRIYLGIESGSQRMLDFYKRGYNLGVVLDAVRMIKGADIEVIGFFISGYPFESRKEFKETLDFARKLNCDYYIIDNLKPYPGTELFEELKDKIRFSIIPFFLDFKKKNSNELKRREKVFYRGVYFNFRFIVRKIFGFRFSFKDFCYNIFSLFVYLTKKDFKKKEEPLDKFI